MAALKENRERLIVAVGAMVQADADNDLLGVDDPEVRAGTRRWALAEALFDAGDPEAEAALAEAMRVAPEWVKQSPLVSAAVAAGASITGWQEQSR